MTVSVEQYPDKVALFTGNHSIIYRSFDSKTHKNIIVKVLKSEYPSINELARFNYEYEIAKSLPFEKVIQVYGIEKYHNTLAIVMEDINGESLSYYLENKPLSLNQFFELAIPIVEVLGDIHGKSVVHKDINPDNIIYNPSNHQLKIIDFGISSTLPRETPELCSPNVLEGTLAYISPEQTGRMNRTIDYRSDYYSLGVTFYQMLTGVLPFQSKDPMTLVHAHIAKTPRSPHEVNPEIPIVLSDIVMKLMSKRAEDRYQSAYGLKYDLEKCAEQLEKEKKIDPFELGSKDISLRFQVPERLYGRQNEIELLLKAFDKTSAGNMALLFVAGYSGIGKSALIHEVQKPIVEKRGYFISGKFDQYKRDIPYSAIIQAFQELLHQILTEGEESIQQWKTVLEDKLKDTLNVITNVIPDLEAIVGPQPPLIEVGPSETQNRFNLVFESFLKVFASENHPLTLFLDDLQWADAPSLNLLKVLFLGQQVKHFLFIGAYRDNEVSPTHMLMLELSELSKVGIEYETLALTPLKIEDVNQIVVDTVRRESDIVAPLTQLCFEKTQGNPFFLNQLLLSLYHEGLIQFDSKEGHWTWEIGQIQAKGISQNVIDLMTAKIQKLSEQTKNILTLAACIGNWFDIKTLSSVNGKSIQESSEDLIEALREGLIVPEDASYKYVIEKTDTAIPYRFLHDRVQQAAYLIISEEDRLALHYRIGHLFLKNTPKENVEERIFEIVSQLNQSISLAKDEKERIALAELNLIAGKKAKASSAFISASEYLNCARSLLPADSWEKRYELTSEINRESAICLYISAEHEMANAILKDILDHSVSILEKAEIALIQCVLFSNAKDQASALKYGLHGLKLLGVSIPEHPSQLSVLKEVLMAKWNLGKRSVESLIDEPMITDKKQLMIIRLYSEVCSPVYLLGNFNLLLYLCLKQVNMFLRYGNTPSSPFACMLYSMVLCGAFGEMEKGQEYGKLGLEIMERYPDLSTKCQTLSTYGMLVHHWHYHRKTLRDYFMRSIEAGVESGNVNFRCYSCIHVPFWNPNTHLETMSSDANKYLQIIRQSKHQDDWDITKLHLQLFENLMGKTKNRFSLSDKDFDEEICLDELYKRKMISGIAIFYFSKEVLCYHYYDYFAAHKHVLEYDKYASGLFALPYMTDHSLYSFLIHAAIYPQLSGKEKRKAWSRMKHEYKLMRSWADHCPVNFLHSQLMMEAEFARLSGDIDLAERRYDEAIQATQKNEYLEIEAIANELAGKFYYQRNLMKSAKSYLLDAYYCFNKWGAKEKLRHLEETYPQFFSAESLYTPISGKGTTRIGTASSGTSQSVSSDILDYSTVVKASQVISGEIVLGNLIKKMMTIVLENAGAEKGYLILKKNDDFFIEAKTSSSSDEIEILQHGTIDSLPSSILNYVISTKEAVILRDATNEGLYTNDPYMRKNRPKSVLCLPLIHQSVMIGLLYFENNLTTDAFTPNRVGLLNVISSQIAISIENAQFYAELEGKVQERTKELRQAQNQLIFQEKMASLGSLTAGIAHELKNPLNFVINFTQIVKSDLEELFGNLDKQLIEKQKSLIDEVKESLTSLEIQGMRADSIIKRMLTHAHEGSKELEKVEINSLVDQAVNLAYHSFLKKDPSLEMKIEADYQKNLPELEVFSGDLSHAFINMIDNACYALSEKRKKDKEFIPTLKIKTFLEGKNVIISIRDNGPGIPKELIEKIFNPFFTTKPTGTGTGLGLSLAYETITSQHGGGLSVKSESGEMTEFIVSLPYKK